MFQVPGAISPSEATVALTHRARALHRPVRHIERLQCALLSSGLGSLAEMHFLVPLRSTQLASAISEKMPGLTSPVPTTSMSSSCLPSGITNLPTRDSGSTSFATAVAAGISVRSL